MICMTDTRGPERRRWQRPLRRFRGPIGARLTAGRAAEEQRRIIEFADDDLVDRVDQTKKKRERWVWLKSPQYQSVPGCMHS